MKTIILLVVTFISCICTSQTSRDYPVQLIKSVNPETEKALAAIYEEVKFIGDWHFLVFVIKIDKKDAKDEIKVSFVPKKDFGWLRRDSKEQVYGTFQVLNDIQVVVFGENTETYFEKLDGTIDLPWLKPSPPLDKDAFYISPILDIPMWVYELKDNKYELVRTAWSDFFVK